MAVFLVLCQVHTLSPFLLNPHISCGHPDLHRVLGGCHDLPMLPAQGFPLLPLLWHQESCAEEARLGKLTVATRTHTTWRRNVACWDGPSLTQSRPIPASHWSTKAPKVVARIDSILRLPGPSKVPPKRGMGRRTDWRGFLTFVHGDLLQLDMIRVCLPGGCTRSPVC